MSLGFRINPTLSLIPTTWSRESRVSEAAYLLDVSVWPKNAKDLATEV
jgi:hypothetical protein